jgi:membrane fusion protein, copper/silver efflux system
MKRNTDKTVAICSRRRLCLMAISFLAYCLLPVAFFAGCRDRETTVAESSHKKQQWTCAMHPEIIRDNPGNCPICGMTLVKKDENTIAVNAIQVDDLLQPTDRFVVSSIPVTTINKKTIPLETEALGTIAYDTRLASTISARVSGRIEKLYVKYRYQHIMKGERIMDIYSPELLTAQHELLFLAKNDPDNFSLINAAKQKLLLLGMSAGQLQQIIGTGKPSLTVTVYSNYSGHVHEAGNTMPGDNAEGQETNISVTTEELPVKEGIYVEKGQNIFQIYNVDRSWVLLNIFPEYQGVIKVNNAVRVIPETAPDKNFRAKIDFIEPFFRKENKTLIARAYFDNSKLEIPAGSQVKAVIFANNNEADWLPKDAVLSLGIDKIVFLKTEGGFKAHKVETGLSYKGQIQVLSGLAATDSVAANAQFLADSESFIKAN